MNNFVIDNYPFFRGTRKEFVNLLKNKFNLKKSDETVISFIKYRHLNKIKKEHKYYYKECLYCKDKFLVYPSEEKFRKIQFCSKRCYGNSKRGKLPLNIKRDDWKKALIKNKENGLYKRHSERMRLGGAIKARLSNKVYPNKPEKILITLIKENNLPFIYIGDGKIWFKGETSMFNPDFLSQNPKQIIELFGDYWHSKTKEKDKERLEAYQKDGYKTLVIWEHELKDLNKTLNKIVCFTNGTLCSGDVT